MVNKTAKQWLLFFGVSAVILAAWNFLAARSLCSLSPPANADTLASFAEQMPEPLQLAQINDDGQTKIVWIGDMARWGNASGPSCYVFDSAGNLVEWDATTGDGEPTTRYLKRAWNAEPLTVQQALDLITSE